MKPVKFNKDLSIWYDLSYFIEVAPDSFLGLLFMDREEYKKKFIILNIERILTIPTFHESINFEIMKENLQRA